MKITDLEKHEQLVLGGLIRLMIRSDGDFSEEEEAKVNAVGERIGGADLIWRVISASAQAYPSDRDTMGLLPQVTRSEVRNLIVDVVEQVAGADGMAQEETSLLEEIKGVWS